MDDPDFHHDTYTVRMQLNGPTTHSVVFAVYDDGHDLQAFFRGSDDNYVKAAVNAFASKEPLHPPFSESKIGNSGDRCYSLTNNPKPADILLAIEKTIQSMELAGFSVARRTNGWQI